MKKFVKIVLNILGFIAMLCVAFAIGLAWRAAEAREANYWAKLNEHVLQYGDTEHSCEYSSEWCNPHYQKFLKESRAKPTK